MRIIFTGGGTGGHIFPVIAVAKELKKIYQGPALEMMFLGPVGPYRQNFEKEGIMVKSILAGKIRRYFSLQSFFDVFKLPLGLIQSLWHLYLYMPDAVFSKGGYGSVPVVLAAWLYFIPVLTHESDAAPGLANRINGVLSKRIALSFQTALKYFSSKKTALIGNPVRSEIRQICLSGNKEEAKSIFNITGSKPTILVLGGSQGAQKINELILSVLPRLLEKYGVIHQCGSQHYEKIKKETGQIPDGYYLSPFLDGSQYAYAFLGADLVISRAGAGSISEIAACAKPSILIPIPDSASDHQRKNAFEYARAGGAAVLEQENLGANLLLSEISEILDNPEISQKMTENAKNFSQPEAGQRIAQALIEMAG